MSESQRSNMTDGGGGGGGGNSYASQSHITGEKINHIKLELERAKLEENQVFEIHHQLQLEVTELEMESHHVHEQQQQIHSEMEIASAERQLLQQKLGQLQEENDKLRAKLRKVEDKEDTKRLDDVLDSMESKMKALRVKSSKRSKERK